MSDNNLFFNSEEIRDLPLRTEFVTGPAGPTGSQGPMGPSGVTGATGAGVISGGLTGQVLAKKTNTDYDTEWVYGAGGSAVWGGITGTLSSQTDLQTVLDDKAPASGISPTAISGTAVITTDSRLSDARTPIGGASGDLSGNYPSPSVVKLQGFSVSTASPITGQSLGWTGSEWSAITPLSVVSWGTITGTLSNQLDLQIELDGKAPSSGISPSAISGTAVITTDARLSDSRSPSGSATGDLGGTYPAPSVAKLQGYSVSATSPSIGQILQWGGLSWIPAAIPQGGSGGGGVNYFFNFNEAAVAPITGLPISPQAPARLSRFATITQSAITSAHLSKVAYDLVAGFVSDPADPDVTQIPAGLWDFNIWADSNANSSDECILRLFVYKYNGTTATLLSESDDIYVYDPTVINQYSAAVVFPFTTILATDRIYIELRGKATTNNIHLSLHFGSVTPSHAHTTFSSVAGTGVVKVVNGVFQTPANLIFDADVDAAAAIAQSKIANLTTDLAGKVTAVSGASPLVSSGGTTPTISIPVATATTDGYLSSANWVTFNAKQPAGTYLTSISATSPISSTGGTSPTISMPQASFASDGYLRSTDWNIFFGKVSTISASLPLVATSGITSTIAIPVATATTNGYLSSTDWTTFNSKQAGGTYVTSVTGTTPIVSSGGTTPELSIPVATATTNGYLSALDWAAFYAKQPAGSYVSSVTSGITGATQLTNMMQITAAGYSAITSPLVNTLYIIVG
jgi:hypothetical protein